jgi:2-polyprenyl-3-methyl-5-hydroxy-6-metoxy-1,4-benzoquinol methylase
VSVSCHGTAVAVRDGREIIECTRCEFAHVFPMYTAAELEAHYANVFSESTPSHLWFEKVQQVLRWKQGGDILDVGCWEGTQLEYFVQAGWNCTGLELNKKAAVVSRSKGIDVLEMSIAEFFQRCAGRTWDVINVAYVLEHIPEPLAFLHQVRAHMNPGGILVLEVPNEFNPFQLAYVKKAQIDPYWIFLPEHVNYFSKDSLERLVQRGGWTILHGESCFPMEMFLLMGDDYLNTKAVGPAAFQKVLAFESALRSHDPTLVSRLYTALYSSGIGRGLTLYLRNQ